MPNTPLDLVAPELAGVLAVYPEVDFNLGIEVVRGGFDERILPPLPPELAAVQVEERFLPNVADGPDVRVLHYTPPGADSGPRPALLHRRRASASTANLQWWIRWPRTRSGSGIAT